MSATPIDQGMPWLRDEPAFQDAFRVNVRGFLQEHGRKVEVPGLNQATAYIVDLRAPDGAITKLHVYEEPLQAEGVAICDQCRCMGASSWTPAC